RNPQLESSAKAAILADLAGDEEPLFTHFLQVVAEKGRAAELEEIAKEFERLMAREERRLTVELTTARELSDAESEASLKQIEQYDVETDLAEVGTVLQIGDGIARIYGLENAGSLEMLELEHGVTGLAFNLEEDDVGAALFGEWEKVSEGEPARRTGRVASVPVGEALLGRVVDPLGHPLDGRGPVDSDETRPLEFKAPGVIASQPV